MNKLILIDLVTELVADFGKCVTKMERLLEIVGEMEQEAIPEDVQVVEMWCDGGTRLGNPGMGYGSWMFEDVHETKEFGRVTTNNESEYSALIHGLKAIAEWYDPTDVELTVKTDSTLVIYQIQGTWGVKADHLRPLRDEARELLRAFRSHRLEHVAGEEMKKTIGH